MIVNTIIILQYSVHVDMSDSQMDECKNQTVILQLKAQLVLTTGRQYLLKSIKIPYPDGTVVGYSGNVTSLWIHRRRQNVTDMRPHHCCVVTRRYIQNSHVALTTVHIIIIINHCSVY